jgi:hypothetical protein
MSTKYDKILERLINLMEDTDAMPDDVFSAMDEAWQTLCAERERNGKAQIRRSKERRVHQ